MKAGPWKTGKGSQVGDAEVAGSPEVTSEMVSGARKPHRDTRRDYGRTEMEPGEVRVGATSQD